MGTVTVPDIILMWCITDWKTEGKRYVLNMVGFELYDRLMEQVFESKEYREDQFVIYSGDRFRV